MFIAKNKNLIILACDTQEELKEKLQFMVYDTIEETDIEYELFNGQYLTQQEIQAQERKHILELTCTKRVFALMLQELGVDYITKLKPLIESNPQAQLEWDLCVELLRANPMLDFMAGKLGVSPEQLDALFLYANGEITKEEFDLFKNGQDDIPEETQEEDLNEE